MLIECAKFAKRNNRMIGMTDYIAKAEVIVNILYMTKELSQRITDPSREIYTHAILQASDCRHCA